MEEFERVCCICGYHVHQEAWEAAVGEELDCEREPNSAHDGYAVAVKRRGVVIDQLPRKLSRLCLLIVGLEIHQNQHGRLPHSIASSLPPTTCPIYEHYIPTIQIFPFYSNIKIVFNFCTSIGI